MVTASPWCIPLAEGSRRAREAALFGTLGAMTFAAKMAMMGLPNIEPVSLMVMVFAVTLGKKALYPIIVYVLLEFMVFGIQLWSINYLYVWPLLAWWAWRLRTMDSPLGWGILSGTFGLLFGALCAPVYLLTGGPAAAVSWWISGIPFDLLHGAGNLVLALVLFRPLRQLMERSLERCR